MVSEARRGPDGFTLLEVVLALFMLAVGVIATAPLFVYAARENAVGGDLGEVGDLAVQRMELLRATDFPLLPNGGDLSTNVAGYHDLGRPGFTVRWVIADNPNPPAGTKIITVRAVAERQVVGQPKRVTLVAVRSD